MRRVGRCGVLLLTLAGCWSATADYERLGDQYYLNGEYGKALAEYQTALRTSGTPALQAKAGSAALRVGDLPAAVEAYLRLGLDDPTRQQEAARGLERVIRAAGRDGSGSVIQAAAMAAMRRAAPDRPLARAVLRPASLDGLGEQEAVAVLPAALGAADGARTVDRLLVQWGRALEATTACETATRVYRTVLRRSGEPGLRGEARTGLGNCALQLAMDAMGAGQAAQAEDWFSTALLADTVGPVSHRARIGLGDARRDQGDLLGAAIWWGSLLSSPGLSDSLRVEVTERLNSIAAAGPPAEGEGA